MRPRVFALALQYLCFLSRAWDKEKMRFVELPPEHNPNGFSARKATPLLNGMRLWNFDRVRPWEGAPMVDWWVHLPEPSLEAALASAEEKDRQLPQVPGPDWSDLALDPKLWKFLPNLRRINFEDKHLNTIADALRTYLKAFTSRRLTRADL